jgi:hypothetical protein
MGTKFDVFTVEMGRRDSESVPGGVASKGQRPRDCTEQDRTSQIRTGKSTGCMVGVCGVEKRIAATTRTKVEQGGQDGL